MDYEGDVMELLETGFPGTIDELMNNIATDHNEKQLVEISENNINGDHLLDHIDTSKGGLGFEAELDTNNKDIQEDFDEIVERFKKQIVMKSDHHDVAISIPADAARDNLKRDKILTSMRKKPSRWSKEEHSRFKRALKLGLKGKWKEMSRSYVPSKTATQITSHAQKYSIRKNNTHKMRKSINDDDTDDDDDDDVHDASSSYKVHNDHQPAGPTPPPEIPGHVNTLHHHHHQQQQVVNYDPSSSMSSSMVNQISPLQVQYPSPMLMMPPPTTMTHHMPIAPPPPYRPYDDVTLYYINCYRRLEEERKMMMLHDMGMATPISGAFSNNVGSSSSSNFAANNTYTTPTPTHHDASYYNNNGHIQWVQPPAEPLVQRDKQIRHVVLPPGQLRQHPTNHAVP